MVLVANYANSTDVRLSMVSFLEIYCSTIHKVRLDFCLAAQINPDMFTKMTFSLPVAYPVPVLVLHMYTCMYVGETASLRHNQSCFHHKYTSSEIVNFNTTSRYFERKVRSRRVPVVPPE